MFKTRALLPCGTSASISDDLYEDEFVARMASSRVREISSPKILVLASSFSGTHSIMSHASFTASCRLSVMLKLAGFFPVFRAYVSIF